MDILLLGKHIRGYSGRKTGYMIIHIHNLMFLIKRTHIKKGMIGVYSIFRHTCSLFWSQISWFYIRVCILISAGHGQKNALSLAQRSRLLTPGSWLTSPEIDKLCPCVYAYIRYHCVVNSPVFCHSSWPRNWLTRPPRASLPEVRKEDHQPAPKPWAITRHGGLWWLGKCMNMDERMAFPLEITCICIYIYIVILLRTWMRFGLSDETMGVYRAAYFQLVAQVGLQ